MHSKQNWFQKQQNSYMYKHPKTADFGTDFVQDVFGFMEISLLVSIHR